VILWNLQEVPQDIESVKGAKGAKAGGGATSSAPRPVEWPHRSDVARQFQATGAPVFAVADAADDARAFLTAGADGWRIWNSLGEVKWWRQGDEVSTIVSSVAPGSNTDWIIATGHANGKLRFVNTGCIDSLNGTLAVGSDFHKARVSALARSPDGSVLASADGTGICCLWDETQLSWDIANLTTDGVLAVPPVSSWSMGVPVVALLFSERGTLFVATSQAIQAWQNGQLLEEQSLSSIFALHDSLCDCAITSLAWCGSSLCIGCSDGRIVACNVFSSG